jgi:peptidoglycan/LPS O-acetylase OafA/YrhL
MGIWSQASQLAAQTPTERNRYVDFLRAVSILVVVVGHWLIATAHYVDGTLTPGHLLKSEPGTQWLTWLFQVMPIFFIVGGYSNAVSLESARRKGDQYAVWLAARLNRLVTPLLILLIAWSVIALIMYAVDARLAVIQFTSKAALIPTWFLAIYIMLVILAPAAYRAWRRFGFASFWAFVALAVLTDIAFFAADLRWLGWSNYFWVWLAVHQLGFAWRDGRLSSPPLLLLYSAVGFVTLYLLISKGPYPLAMVGSPDEGLSNTLPPKVTLIALGVFQFGLLLALEGPMRRVLESLRLWTATVLINSMIMTLYLWHITVMVLLGTIHDALSLAHHRDGAARHDTLLRKRLRVRDRAGHFGVVVDAADMDRRIAAAPVPRCPRVVAARAPGAESRGEDSVCRTTDSGRSPSLPGHFAAGGFRLRRRDLYRAGHRLVCAGRGRRRTQWFIAPATARRLSG